MTKYDVRDILYDITDSNKVFELNDVGHSLKISMNIGTEYDKHQFHSQDDDITDSLLRLTDIGVPIMAEIKDGWRGEKKVKWTPDLQEWCYSISAYGWTK